MRRTEVSTGLRRGIPAWLEQPRRNLLSPLGLSVDLENALEPWQPFFEFEVSDQEKPTQPQQLRGCPTLRAQVCTEPMNGSMNDLEKASANSSQNYPPEDHGGNGAMCGWTGFVLRVDLSSGTISREPLDRQVLRRNIGGKGLAGHFLAPLIHLPWDDPDMPLCLFTGPLAATISPTSGRASMATRSPLTGTYGDASAGGDLGTQLKRAGLDGLIVTGRAKHPVGIVIEDGRAEIRDASVLAGFTRSEVREILDNHGDQQGRGIRGSLAVVGPAAEAGVRFANVMVDTHHAFGRGGLGLSWAAKNLKYLSVAGSGKVRVADPEGLKKAREDIFRLVAASPVLSGGHGFSCFGTGALYDLMDSRRMMPTDNFRSSHFAPAGHLNAVRYKERYRTEKHGCRGCHIQCKQVAADGRSIPEFETMSHFTALIGLEDIELVVAANSLCNELGMDTISSAVTLACHAEITGARLTPDRVLEILEDIGRGRLPELGLGAAGYAASKGRPEAAMTVKGLELPAYDPRGAYGMSLAYALSTRGGCHLRAYPVSHEILRKPVATDRFSFLGKARIIKIAEDTNAVVDSLTACKFIFFGASLEEYAAAYQAVTGENSSTQGLLRLGERICYRERIMNARLGFSSIDDDIPTRFFEPAGIHGLAEDIRPVPRQDFLDARAKYYAIRGLTKDGMPTREKAEELGLAESFGIAWAR
jgi:aldehyde:ferredoxin oxidoreductase